MHCCGTASCKEKILEKHTSWTEWAVAVWTVMNKLYLSVCDNCFKLSEEIHRFLQIRNNKNRLDFVLGAAIV